MTTIEQAIRTAIEYETKVHDVYEDAAQRSVDEVGKRVFGVLAGEEQRHLEYLHSRMEEWLKTGQLQVEELATIIPSRRAIREGINRLERRLPGQRGDAELSLLRRALDVEIETSDFYRRLVGEMEGDGQRMFARFLEIEEGHLAIVQAEIDALTHMGFWFDFQEFNLEG
jgi:rubrerythrin